MPDHTSLQSIALEVKGGTNAGIGAVRDLRGVLERDTALMAGLIVMDDLGQGKTDDFAAKMAAAGDLRVNDVPYPRIQMLTVPEILKGKRFHTPSAAREKSVSQPIVPGSIAPQ